MKTTKKEDESIYLLDRLFLAGLCLPPAAMGRKLVGWVELSDTHAAIALTP
jgi:hypothetical protein